MSYSTPDSKIKNLCEDCRRKCIGNRCRTCFLAWVKSGNSEKYRKDIGKKYKDTSNSVHMEIHKKLGYLMKDD